MKIPHPHSSFQHPAATKISRAAKPYRNKEVFMSIFYCKSISQSHDWLCHTATVTPFSTFTLILKL